MADGKTNCTHCGGHIAFPKELAGQQATCPHCNELLTLPTRKSGVVWLVLAALVVVVAGLAAAFIAMNHFTNHAATAQASSPRSDTRDSAPPPPDPLATSKMISLIKYGSNNVDLVKQLVQKGADVNAKDDDGWPSLQLAAKQGNLEVVRVLLDGGADVNATNSYGGTALISAAARGYLDIVELLLAQGADMNIKFRDKSTCISSAVRSGNTNLVNFLLSRKANIEDTNDFGSTLLMQAVHYNDTNMVKFLLAEGANVSAEDSVGMNALDVANYATNATMVDLLKNAGATVSSTRQTLNDLNKIAQLAAAFTNVPQNLPAGNDSAAAASDKPDFEVINVTAKPTEQNDTWWRYGYRLTVRNNSSDFDTHFFEIQFLDSDGYVIYSTTADARIRPGGTEVITGDTLVDLPGAAKIAHLKAFWKS